MYKYSYGKATNDNFYLIQFNECIHMDLVIEVQFNNLRITNTC